MFASLQNKKVTTIPKVETIADGIAVQTPGDFSIPLYRKVC